jgi:TetR/AcrR family transcriptional repressor of nem operon
MGRTREFDPEIALEEAMRLFWEKGYHDTSVRDLVARTGVSHAGIYGTLGNKQEVFSAALQRYQEEIMGKVLEALEAPGASLPEVTGHFERLYELAKDPRFRAGCMICNSAVDLAQENPEVASGFQRHLDRLVAAFRVALVRAKEKGEVREDLDPAAAADVLAATQTAMALFLRAQVNHGRIVQFARHALATAI